MGMLLVAAAAWLLLSALLQVPPLASAAALPRFPKIPARSPQLGKRFKDFITKHGPDAVDVAQNFLPPPGEDSNGGGRMEDSAPAQSAGLYIAELLVGTPAATIFGVLDISTQLVWMQCAPCTACMTPPPSYFQPSASSTGRWLLCASKDCQISLAPQYCAQINDVCRYAATYLVYDTFTFGTTAVENMLFGCSYSTTGDYSGASGVIGLSRGPLSLVSQLGLSNFSYFLAPDDDSGSEVQLGGVAVPQTGRSHSTPLLGSGKYKDLYYVRLTGIHVDGEELDGIPPGTFDLRDDGSGGVFLSTTVPVTYLLSEAYVVVREAFASRIPLRPDRLGSLDPLCYKAQSMAGIEVPRLTLVFQGADAAMELRTANYFYRFSDGDSDLECLSVLPSSGASLLGSLLQTGKTMIYDLVGQELTFVVMEDAPPPSQASLVSEALAASLAVVVAVTVSVWVLLF